MAHKLLPAEKRMKYLLYLFLLFMLGFVSGCGPGDKGSSIMLYIGDEILYVDEYYSMLQSKREGWNYYESSTANDGELKYMVLRELIIEKMILDYGRNNNKMPDDSDFYKALEGIFGGSDYFSEESLREFRRSFQADFILSSAIKDRIKINEEEVRESLKDLGDRVLEPASLFLVEFVFDNESDASDLYERVVHMDNLDDILCQYSEFELSNPNTDLNIIGYIPEEKARGIIGSEEEPLENTFSSIIEGSQGYLIYFIKDKRPEIMMTANEKYERALLSARIDREREEKERFLKELYNRTNIKIVVNDEEIDSIVKKINTEFK